MRYRLALGLILVMAFAAACQTGPVATVTPIIFTHQLEVVVDPPEAGDFLLNPKPLDKGDYVRGRTVVIDVLPQRGWKVSEWVGPVQEVSGATARVTMDASKSIIVRMEPASSAAGRPGNGQPSDGPVAAEPKTSTRVHISTERLAPSAPCLGQARAAYDEGKVLDGQGQYERAIERMDEATRLDPGCAEAYSGRGFARLHIGQNEEALRDYNDAIRLAPEADDLYNSYYNRGLVYSDLGQHRQAIRDFDEAIRLHPGQGWLYDGRARVYDRVGDEHNATADRNQACQFGVDRPYCAVTGSPTPAANPTATAVPIPALMPTPTAKPAATPAPPPALVPTSTPVPKFTVTKTADTYDGTCDADCSLREATIAAGQEAIIKIPAGTYTLEFLELTIYKDLSLIGAGAQSTILQAANSPERADHAVLDIERNNIVSISGVTIRHGNTEFGGGIINDGTLTVTGSSIIQNLAENGAGIHNTGTLTLIDTVVSNNTAAQYGGGIYNEGELTLQDSLISDNEAVRRYGGGIYHNDSDGLLSITGSTISGNDAHYGGGINGGGLVMTDSTVSGNSSRSNGGGIHGGGTLINSVLSGNTAREDGGGFAGFGTLTNVTISGNIAGQRGGAASLLTRTVSRTR